jgi:hypothetical protein
VAHFIVIPVMLAWLRHSKSKRPVIVVNMLFERKSGLLLVGMATYKFGENPILLILRQACKHFQTP